MVQIRRLDASNVSYKDAVSYSDALLDSFEEDAMLSIYFPPRYQLTTISASDRRRLVRASARSIYQKVLHGRFYFYLLEEQPGRAEAVALWQWPVFYKTQPASRVYTWLVDLWVRVADWWDFLGSANPFDTPGMIKEYEILSRTCNADSTPERLAELEACTPQQLESETYPKDYCYYCKTLAVRQSAQGKGYGRTVMTHSEQDLPQDRPQFGSALAPAKIGMFSSPVAHEFYKRLGYTLVASFESKLANGGILPHRYFQKSLVAARAGAPASAA